MTAVAERIAPQQPPGREHGAPQRAEGSNRLDRIGRAGGLVLAPPRKRRRYEPLVEPYGGAEDPAAIRLTMTMPPSRSRSSQAARAARQALSGPRRVPRGSTISPAPARATTTKSWSSGRLGSRDQKASLNMRLTVFRSTAPPTRRPTDTPNRACSPSALSCASSVPALKAYTTKQRLAADRPRRYTRSKSALRVSRGRLCRMPPVDPLKPGALDRQARASLLAPPLDRQAPRPRPHPRTEPVRAGTLALLGLIRPLHNEMAIGQALRLSAKPDLIAGRASGPREG